MRNPRNEPLGSETAEPTGRADSAPERRCVLSGDTRPRDGLLRLALGPEGDVLPDVLAKAPGRGAWIAADKHELADANRSGKLKAALSRAFRSGQLDIPDDLPERAEAALRRAFVDRLGVENRGGNVLTGSDRIARAARGGQVVWLGHAADAGEDGARTLDQAWRVGSEAEASGMRGVRLPLDREALSVALGRENVVHLALTDTNAARRVTILLERLLHFLGRGESAASPEPERTGDESRRDTVA